MTDGWIDKPLDDLITAFRAGILSPIDLYEEAWARREGVGKPLNAYRVWDETHSRGQAIRADAAFRAEDIIGPLQGIPVSVKDLFGVGTLDTFAGSPQALPEKWNTEGPMIKALRNQGAVLTGKTHMVEFAFGGLGTNAHWPIPRNPWDAKAHRVCGGSSSGAGVSLIEGSALVALGTDTAGSVRVPASVTGTVGLKITAGRWPTNGIVPLSPTFDTPGILTRSIADAALVFEAIDAQCAGRTSRPAATPADMHGVRIGVVEHHFWEDCADDIAGPVREAISELEKAGAKIVTMDWPGLDKTYSLFRQGSLVSSEFRAFMTRELPDWIETLDPNVSFRMASALGLDDEDIIRRRGALADLTAATAQTMKNIDVVITPTVPLTPPKLADIAEPKAYSAANLQTLKNTCIANLLGLCAITMPVALDAHAMPVGLQCMAAAGAEERLLATALAFERQLGTAHERLGKPPLAA